MTSYVAFGLILVAANLHLCVSDQFEESVKRLKDVYDYVSELRERSDTTLIYLTRIQQIFCPEQPICDDGKNDGTNNDAFLSENLYIGNESKSVKDLKYIIGVCCLPCSCSDRCSEDDNCCLSKDVASVTSGAVKSECITANVDSYKRIIPEAGLMYFMINRCFRNDTDMSTISKCESPDQYLLGDTIPVTSLTTGRTYWNKPCAKCNADADDVLPWNSTAIFNRFVLHKPRFTNQQMIPQSPEEFFTYLRESTSASIIYTPPVPMQHKECVTYLPKCTDQENELTKENDKHSFFFDTCQQHTSPVLIGYPRGLPYKNIFCFFCQSKVSNSRPSCDAGRGGRLSTGQVSGLLNYRRSTKDDSDDRSIPNGNLVGGLRGKCTCNQVYDTYIGDCRSLFCPPGEFLGVCQCVNLIANITGMRVFLRLKVEPQAGQTLPSTEAKRRKMRVALRKILTTTSKGNDVDIYATFTNTNSTRPYYFVIATITSTPGNDIREVTKPFLEYLDDSNFMEIKFDKTNLKARLTNRVDFWYDEMYLFKAKEIKGKSELTPIYLKTSLQERTFYTRMLTQGEYQILTPLLFCLQVQLDGNEFQEKDGIIQVNTTETQISVYDFIRMDDTHVRVCVEDYLPAPARVSSGTGQNLQTIALLCLSIICKYFLIK